MSEILKPDSVLANRYRIVTKIGKGGMAEVFRGIDQALEREVAVKVLTDRSDEVCRRFLLEAQSMARLNHPNIVAVYDVGVDRHLSYIVLEYVKGKTLRELNRTNFSFARTIGLAIQLLEALDCAHSQGIIHRDIKPGNVMLAEDGSLKVMDFGLARRMTDMSNLTQSGEIVGTIAYLPPERFLGKPGDKSSDLYSVGVLMYELVCGSLPFPQQSADLVAIMYAHVNQRPRPPRLLNPTIPPSLDRIIMRLLEKEPSQRYSDALSLASDLRAVSRSLSTATQKTAKTSGVESEVSQKSPSRGDADELERHVEDGEGQTNAIDPSHGGYVKSDLLTSKTFTAALARIMQGMMCARRQQWQDAEDHYTAAVGMLTPLQHPSELARTYARLGGLYCAKIKVAEVVLPSEVNAAKQYLMKALPILREKNLAQDIKEAEANLRSLEALRSSV